MNGFIRRTIPCTILMALAFVFIESAPLFSIGTALSITIKNETGYALEELKCVRETGNIKNLIDHAQNLSEGGACTFHLDEAGAYRIYASFTIGGKRVYAKGSAHKLQSGGSYQLTLKEVVLSRQGSNLNFIDKGEFEAIK